MVSATVSNPAGDIVETYTYDYLGNRTSKTSNGVTTKFTTDLSSGYAQVLKAEKDSEVTYFTRGFELISKTTNGETVFYLYDGGSSVRALTDESGAVTDTLVFDAFGNETEKTGTTENSYGFQGEEQDSTGLYYLRARYMDPATGTFTSMDTYGGSLSDPMSLHKYLFANSNPVMYSDPSGHSSLSETVAVLAITSILAAEMSGILYVFKLDDSGTVLSESDFYSGLWQSVFIGALSALLMGIVAIGLAAIIGPVLAANILGSVGLGLSIYEIYNGVVDLQQGMFKSGVMEIAFGIIGTIFSGLSIYNGIKGLIACGSNNGYGEAHDASNYAKLKEQYKVTELANDVVDSLNETGQLPSNYITKSEAESLGWKAGKALDNYAPGKAIGGDIYSDSNCKLPAANGRVWYEADVGIDYSMSRSNPHNPGYRIVYSNDGLIYGS